MKGRRIEYFADELAWIEARKDWPRRDLHRAFVARFEREDVSFDNLNSLCKRRGWMTGRTGHFPAGVPSWSAGRKGLRHAGSEKGWFRPGERQGVARRLWKPIGTERVSADGYVERKVNDDLPLQRRWRAVHLIRWEALHGPVPEGHALKCLDGDRQNTDPANWAAVPRALMPRINGRKYDQAEPEVKPAIMAVARLEQRAAEIRKGK